VPPHDPSSSPAASRAARDDVRAVPTTDEATPGHVAGHEGAPGIVDWHRTGRRLRRQLLVIVGTVVVAWLAIGVVGDGHSLRSLAELVGLGVLLAIAAEIFVVGGAAVRGLLAAGERGDRLASADVSLLPPQVSRRLRGRRR
jgi:hypothetical protein